MSIYWCLNIFNLEQSFRNIPTKKITGAVPCEHIWYDIFQLKKSSLSSKTFRNPPYIQSMASWNFITFGHWWFHWWFHFENERNSDFGLILASNKQILENKFLFTPSLGLNTLQNKVYFVSHENRDKCDRVTRYDKAEIF